MSEPNSNDIRKITPTGTVSVFASGFNAPEGLAIDSSGNLYVADSNNHVIRKVTSAGVVSVVAGAVGSSGSNDSTDGTGATARFMYPFGVAVDTNGYLYVADTLNYTIRKIMPAGAVTTLAGLVGSNFNSGTNSIDGTGSAARFDKPCGITVDASGVVYVADTYGSTIRKITPAGVVTTIAGSFLSSGNSDANGTAARFNRPWGITLDNVGNLFVTDTNNNNVRKIILSSGSVSTVTDVTTGNPVSFTSAEGVALNINLNLFVVGSSAVNKGVLPSTPPTATIGSVTNVVATGAQLNGTVNAAYSNTTVVFQYGTDGVNFPNQVTATPGTVAGGTDTAVNATLTGLTNGGLYYYRILATNSSGPVYSGVNTFIPFTQPSATADSATILTTTSVQVFGTYNPQGTSPQLHFDYGTDSSMAFYNTVPTTPTTVSGYTATTVSSTLPNLTQGTTYYYRLRGTSGANNYISGNKFFQTQILSGFSRQFPSAPPDHSGSLQVSFVPNITPNPPGWRFVGEQLWRASGATVGGLVPSNYDIEYQPAPGYIQPPQETISIAAGTTTVVNEEYYTTPGGATGGLEVVLIPSNLSQAQWRFYGQNDSQWNASGTTITGLNPGNYLIECKPVAGQTTPPPSSITVPSGSPVLVTLTYLAANTSPSGAQPAVLSSFATVTNSSTSSLPYAYVGQIRSDVGSATGFVVKDRVVATAAHVVFDQSSLLPVTGLQWLFQRWAGTYEPVPIIPHGFYAFTGYAAQRAADANPGSSSASSQDLDVAVLYFTSSAGGGGYSGYLASDSIPNEFLTSPNQKMLVGYPVDGEPAANQGQMFATAAVPASFTEVPGTDSSSQTITSGNFFQVYTTSDLTSVGGNSGGPLCVQYSGDGKYYPAAIYLGGSGQQTSVRAIDSNVISLFSRAEVSGEGGANNVGGGIDQVDTGISGGSASYASIRVLFAPAAVASTATWAIGTTFFHNGDSISGRRPGPYTLTVTPVSGYITPSPATVMLTGGLLSTISVTYQPVVVPPQVVTFTSASTIPISTSSYSVNGAALSLVLSYAPTPGTVLTAIQITGGSAITGTFTNLPNGGTITATFNGFNYTFTANYSGGTGHDLTLTLASIAPSSTDTPTMPTWALILFGLLVWQMARRHLSAFTSRRLD